MDRYTWQQLWKRFLLWTHVAGIVGLYTYAWWHAPFSKREQARVKKLSAHPVIPAESPQLHPIVSIIVPARNEENTIRRCLTSLLDQDFVQYEVIAVDDNSTDTTADIIKELACSHPSRDRLHRVHVQELPAGWSGKPHAIHIGVQKARGEWLLFTDADTWHSPAALRVALTLAEEEQADLLTLGLKQELQTFWEHVLMPMAYLATSIRFPIRHVNNPNSIVASANGQYILIRRQTYEAIGGYSRYNLRNAILDDIELGRVVKESGFRLRFMDCGDLAHVHMYNGLREMWQGWLKNAFLSNKRGIFSVIAELIELPIVTILPFLLPILALIPRKQQHPDIKRSEFSLAIIIELASLFIYRIWINKMLQIRWYYIFTHFLAGAIFEGLLARSMWNVLTGKGINWKDRRYYKAKP